MTLGNLTDVLYLSCILFVFVKSQTPCADGWFGESCNYKCRCTNDACDTNGKCTDHNNCQGGWFGPECQYADLAFSSTNDEELVDSDDRTCLNRSSNQRTKLVLREPFYFTWLRVIVALKGAATLRDLSLTFGLNTVKMVEVCPDLKKILVDNTTLDVHCNLTDAIDEMYLDGVSASYICSVYVSGGRNVALKEQTFQDTTFSEEVAGVRLRYPSDKAVDGNTDKHFYNGQSCSRTSNQRTPKVPVPTWGVQFKQERAIHRYVIYNRGDTAANLLVGFRLLSFDALNKTQFTYKDTDRRTKQLYTIYHRPLPVGAVLVMIDKPNGTLTLCEVEVYGESICDEQHYGRQCELECQCPFSEPCFVATGGCDLGCKPGYQGPKCVNRCLPGRFGDRCNSTCYQRCQSPGLLALPLCNHVTGVCSVGCKPGYTGRKCDRDCPVGKHGENCSSSCSKSCATSSSARISPCNGTTGACIKGCKSGFYGNICEKMCGIGKFGPNCQSVCSEGCEASNNATISPCNRVTGDCINECKTGYFGDACESLLILRIAEIIAGLCLATAVAYGVAYCCSKKKKLKTTEERATVPDSHRTTVPVPPRTTVPVPPRTAISGPLRTAVPGPSRSAVHGPSRTSVSGRSLKAKTAK